MYRCEICAQIHLKVESLCHFVLGCYFADEYCVLDCRAYDIAVIFHLSYYTTYLSIPKFTKLWIYRIQ